MIEELNKTGQDHANRTHCIHLLQEYRDAGLFPINNEAPGAFPIFKDSFGTYCAVGYLVAKTAGCVVADAIDQQYHNSYVIGDIEHDERF
jgi:hypothetical protein